MRFAQYYSSRHLGGSVSAARQTGNEIAIVACGRLKAVRNRSGWFHEEPSTNCCQEAVVTELSATWLKFLRAYLGMAFIGNFAWEVLHLPLYTIWRTGTTAELIFAVVHCTFGDLLIAGTHVARI